MVVAASTALVLMLVLFVLAGLVLTIPAIPDRAREGLAFEAIDIPDHPILVDRIMALAILG